MKNILCISILSLLSLILGAGVAPAQTLLKESEVVAQIKEYRIRAAQLETCTANQSENSAARFDCEVSLGEQGFALFAGSKIVSGETHFDLTSKTHKGLRFEVHFSPKMGGYTLSIMRHGRRSLPGKRPFAYLEEAYKRGDGTVFRVVEFRLADETLER